jgi:hypothetical protein
VKTLPTALLALTPWFLGSWFLVPCASAATPALTITYDMSGAPLTITHDGAGVYSFDGLPYPGTVLYTPANGVVYYQHPEDPVWHTVTPAMLRSVVVPAAVSQGPTSTPWQDQSTFRWNITTPAAMPGSTQNGGTACRPIFGSSGAAEMSGLNVADIAQVLTTLQWLNAGSIPNPCEKLQYSAEQATKIGLPTILTGPNGNWQLQEVVQTSATATTLPMAYPMDDATRLRLLLIQFSPEERATLLTKFGSLPTQQQIDAISPLLTQEVIVP